MAIVYDSVNNVITVTGTYTDLFQDIYDADQAGGWGVLHKQGNRQFYSEARIVIGDGSTSTAVSDKRAHLEFEPDAVPSGGIGITVENNASLTFGELVDATAKVVRYGVDVMYPVKGSGVHRYLIRGFNGSQINLYGCSFRGFTNTYYSLWIRGVITAYHCLFDRVELRNVSGELYDLVFVQIRSSALRTVTATMDEIRLFTSAAFMVEATSGLTVSNVVARGITTFYYAYYQSGNSYLINADSDAWTFIWSNSPNAKIYRQYEFDLTVTDKENNAISGATVTLKDKDDNQVFQVTTDAQGEIATQTVSRGWYEQATGDTLNEYSPHTLTIEKAGCQTYERKLALEEKTKWEIKLAKAVGVFLDFGRPVVNLKKSDPESKNVVVL